MTSWILIATLAYLLNAVAFVVDKYLLALPIPKPFTYAFWVAALSSSAILLIPFFDIVLPSTMYFAISFISGAAFFGGLIFLYSTIIKTDVSVASTQVGVLTAIFTYLLSLIILKEVSPLHNATAIALLVFGMLFLGRAGKGITVHAIFAGALIAISFVLLKWTFITGDFVNGIFWTRMGFVGAALLSLTSRRAREEVKTVVKGSPIKSKLVFVANKLLAGTAFLLLYYSILLGDVTTINALLGLQFLFVFLIAIAIRRKFPQVEEKMDKRALMKKSIGIALVLAGFLSILN